MTCNNYPTPEDMQRLKANSDFETEFVESSAFTSQTPEGKTKLTISGIADKSGGQNKGNYLDDPLLEDNVDYAYFAATQTKYKIAGGVTAPYQVDSTTYPDPETDPNLTSFDFVNSNNISSLTDLVFDDVASMISSAPPLGSSVRWTFKDSSNMTQKNGGHGFVVSSGGSGSNYIDLGNGNYVYITSQFGPVEILTPVEASEDHLLFKTRAESGPTRMHIEPAGNIEGTTAKLDWMFDPYDETPQPDGRPRDYRIFNIYTKTGNVSGLNGESGAAILNVKDVGDFWGIWPSMHFSVSDDGASAMKFHYFDTSDTEWRTPVVGRWREGATFNINDIVTCDNKIYKCLTAGVSGANRLTHDSGTASDGNLDWDWVRSPIDHIAAIKPCMLFGDRDDMPIFGHPNVRAQYSKDALFQIGAKLGFAAGDSSYIGGFSGTATTGVVEYTSASGFKVQFGSNFFKLIGGTQRYSRTELTVNTGDTDLDFNGEEVIAVTATNPVSITDFLNAVPDSEVKIIPRDNNVTLVHDVNKLRLRNGANQTLSSNNYYTFYVDQSGVIRQHG